MAGVAHTESLPVRARSTMSVFEHCAQRSSQSAILIPHMTMCAASQQSTGLAPQT